ncbi:hypothetical protein ACLQ8T_15285 [Glutamicibacter sp. FR1]|uniref:hypothetical protein n=1 Tax=Glutamicibacter sp. FR1 TaxID=3393744 RepID=UPI0039AEB8BE
MELAKHNITVNSYAPGVVGTAMRSLIDERLTAREGTPRGSALQAQVDNILAGRVIRAGERRKAGELFGRAGLGPPDWPDRLDRWRH